MRRLTTLLGSLLLLLGIAVAAPPAYADAPAPGTAPPLRFVTYNICGHVCVVNGTGPDDAHRTATVVAEAANSGWRADYIFLQEVCKYQFDDIKAKLPAGFTGLFAELIAAGESRGGKKVCKGSAFGEAVFVRGTPVSSTVLTLTAGGESEQIKSPCIQSWVQNRRTWACSVHLYWNERVYNEANGRTLAAQTRAWEDAGIPVVLGGDFNGQPGTTTTLPFYTPGTQQGAGTMTEVDESDSDYCPTGPCRAGEPTFHDGRKLDYLFATSRFVREVVGDSLPQDATVSDHRLLRGAAAWADCGPVGPGAAGMFRVDSAGMLFHYTGRSGGALGPACKRGYGWGYLRHIARQDTTLVAIDPDGVLWRYPADPVNGRYSGGTRVRAGTGFGSANALLTPGDVDSDGLPDLVVRDTQGVLRRYPGTADGGYGAPVTVAAAGTAWSTYDLLLAPGDFARDAANAPDLLGRTADGGLWLHRGDGRGGYGPATKIGTNWQVYSAMAATGDVDGDGNQDFLGRDAAGALWFYRGNGTGGYATRTQIGSAPTGEPLF
ncbi:endonuclease/exonuclease/phosphatase family protein [Actinoplanes sp. NPDC024001]|uniref:endonuclease/exonuclease/phosphatase family protein n=1 Tax=Actinoplanes sp. NPDC024001 TaxID=3154598 RepID=UPI0033DFC3FD